MSASGLYESYFVASAALTIALSLIVVMALRAIFLRWSSTWPKTIAIHTANLLILLTIGHFVYDLVPGVGHAQLTNGGLLTFVIIFMMADGFSRSRATLAPSGTRSRQRQWIILSIGALVAVGALRMTANSDQGRAAIEMSRWAQKVSAIMLGRSEGMLFRTLIRTFPQEGGPLIEKYVHATRTLNRGDLAGDRLPPFPTPTILEILAAHNKTIAEAPDADLLRLGRAMQSAFADMDCSILEPGADAARRRELQAPASGIAKLDNMIAAALLAARGGIDHPTPHPLDEASLHKTNEAFTAFAAAKGDLWVESEAPPPALACRRMQLFALWTEGLSDAALVQVMAQRRMETAYLPEGPARLR